jgi:hypothetical protein
MVAKVIQEIDLIPGASLLSPQSAKEGKKSSKPKKKSKDVSCQTRLTLKCIKKEDPNAPRAAGT